MRVVSQLKFADVDYESNSFIIAQNEDRYAILCVTNSNILMGEYSTKEKAQKAFIGMSSSYKKCLITTQDNYMQVTDRIVAENDKPFERIEIGTVETPVYYMPQEDEVHE